MPKLSSSPAGAAVTKAPGSFLSDGCYLEQGQLSHRGHIDRLVRALVAERRRGGLSITKACNAIRAASATIAFPWVDQWEKSDHWAMVWTATSAEESVKREGRVVDGHRCGQRFAAGPEKDCPDDRHRPGPCPPETKAALERMFGAFGVRPIDMSQPVAIIDDDEPPPPEYPNPEAPHGT